MRLGRLALGICGFAWGVSLACGQEQPASEAPLHPYLYFSAEDIPALRARMEDPALAVRRTRLISRANSLLNAAPNTSPRQFQGDSALLAFAYVVTGDERYGARAIGGALATAALPTWGIGFSWNRGADLETAERCVGMALVYDWCHDLLTASEKATLIEATVRMGIEPYLSSIDPRLSPNWWVYAVVNNWRGVSHGGSTVAALAFFHESEKAREAAEAGYYHIPLTLRQLHLIDSGGHEGVTYNNYGIEYALLAATAYQRFYGGLESLLLELADDRLGAYWDMHMHAPDLHFANIGRMNFTWAAGLFSQDGRTEGGPSSLRAALFDSVVPGGDRLLRWAADNGGQRFYWNAASPFYFLWRRAAPSLWSQPRPDLQEAVLFRGAGHAVWRSEDLYLAFSGGATHNRGDAGAFVLLSRGERLIHLEPSLNFLESAYQSTLLVNGMGQSRGDNPLLSARFLRFGSAEGFHYLASDIRPVYPVGTTLTRAVRHLVMVRGRYLVILDDIAAGESVPIEARFQSSLQWRLQNGGALIQGQQNDLHLVSTGFDPFQFGTGSGGALNYVSLRRTARSGTLLTVLFPVSKGAPAPTVEEEDGVVTISVGTQTDTLSFEHGLDGWFLAAVNGVEAHSLTNVTDRNITPYRDGRPDPGEIPPWLFPEFIDEDPLPAPEGLSASPAGSDRITLTWDPVPAAAVVIHLQRRLSPEPES